MHAMHITHARLVQKHPCVCVCVCVCACVCVCEREREREKERETDSERARDRERKCMINKHHTHQLRSADGEIPRKRERARQNESRTNRQRASKRGARETTRGRVGGWVGGKDLEQAQHRQQLDSCARNCLAAPSHENSSTCYY